MEKLLPQNVEAECGVLGSIIIDPEALPLVADFLLSEDFYRDAHRTLYSTLLYLSEKRTPGDFITVCDELERRGQLEDIGGASYITSLINQVPTSGNVEFYGRIVERTAILRRLIHGAGQIAAIAYEEGDADTAISQSEEIVYKISQKRKVKTVSSMADVVSRYQNKLEEVYKARKQGTVFGVPTGFHKLDRWTGGLQRADLIILAARPGIGKSSFAMNAAYNASEHGFSSMVFSLEMSEEQVVQRLTAGKTGIDQSLLRTGQIEEDEWLPLVEAFGELAEGRMWIDDTSAISLMEVRSRARRMQAEYGLDMIIVDYLQLMSSGSSKKYENRVQEVSEISRGLKGIARELNIPVLALAQLSRAVEARQDKVPQLSDLRESGTLEQDADIVVFLHCKQDTVNLDARMQSQPHLIDLIVAKHRNGPVGADTLQFVPKLTKFHNIVQGRPAA